VPFANADFLDGDSSYMFESWTFVFFGQIVFLDLFSVELIFLFSMVSNKTNTDLWNDDRLVSFLKQGDEGAFRILVRRYKEKIYSIAFGITQDREESMDIVQEVFLKTFQHIHAFRKEATLSTWLHRITINQSLNLKRKWKRRLKWHHQPIEKDQDGDYPELGTDDYSPANLYQEKELQKVFRERLEGLPEEARAVYVLKEVENLSYDQIASTLNLKKGTVSSRLRLS
jgi:RNA polymerase sigma-70 factor (ECF subfamily)|tara:strand:- start:5121 stop:5804 length:684 start_codon:yes stop_codon:yes gene_type:complete